ncbi:class I SAM-dependent methyltransferase [Anaerotruncus sp. 1XD42-93]|jgi:23S rRNA (cytosine1962-C5)-methyltransferase|uniref:class I SAM-dependent methyltransferase n=1 Tax=Anaerotruncus sp. 1XD42-93 TaxID=2320853 RepID=UPI000EA40A70|nr:class I SAM-dependent methyltransferase [Anaerotruncus sp. 1XD42-93]MCI9235333.1 SAM-dependent methyltransferase [Anaerotruncus sp.]NBK17834.1 SAM-dependent methyltransferase [Anaerotruncus sp. 1XD42-93]NCE75728.1 SAM-dependent methyltransferase [Anaerotruncus sp. X29]RKJ93786.1 SAM-dependent methyltransferase [Anaerotruncus sp. 1XD22-93]
MRAATGWSAFEVLDASAGEKLERWGQVTLVRPDPQVIWNTPRDSAWEKANARYNRSSEGGGSWSVRSLPQSEWEIPYRELRFRIRPTGFKHTGLFPEQAVNWDLMSGLIRAAGRQLNILNLFAYTGGATLACAAAGARVCHVDASKGMVQWARENAALSGLSERPVRWIVDDCKKFVEREIRRGVRYDGVVMDPPSYGRGPGGEVWKLEDSVYELVRTCAQVLSEDARFFLLNSYTTGLSPSVMQYILSVTVGAMHGGTVTADEIGLPVKKSGLVLPCGSTAVWMKNSVSL